MKYRAIIALLFVSILFTFFSCEHKSPMETNVTDLGNLSQSYTISAPQGATVNSATLWLYVYAKPGEPINGYAVGVHRVTQDWTENAATWNNFFVPDASSGYVTSAMSTFKPTSSGWISVDITPVVQRWVDGNDNFGVLLKQVVKDDQAWRELYLSSEDTDNKPYLVVKINGVEYANEIPFADTELIQGPGSKGDENYGGLAELGTGFSWNGEGTIQFEKRSLLKWDLQLTPPEETNDECTRPTKYWIKNKRALKKHIGHGIWLGKKYGKKSIYVNNYRYAKKVLKKQLKGGYGDNDLSKLYCNLLTSKLNKRAGADCQEVENFIHKADDLICNYDQDNWRQCDRDRRGHRGGSGHHNYYRGHNYNGYNNYYGYNNHYSSNNDKWYDDVKDLNVVFTKFNNGEIGPGHCGG